MNYFIFARDNFGLPFRVIGNTTREINCAYMHIISKLNPAKASPEAACYKTINTYVLSAKMFYCGIFIAITLVEFYYFIISPRSLCLRVNNLK